MAMDGKIKVEWRSEPRIIGIGENREAGKKDQEKGKAGKRECKIEKREMGNREKRRE